MDKCSRLLGHFIMDKKNSLISLLSGVLASSILSSMSAQIGNYGLLLPGLGPISGVTRCKYYEILFSSALTRRPATRVFSPGKPFQPSVMLAIEA